MVQTGNVNYPCRVCKTKREDFHKIVRGPEFRTADSKGECIYTSTDSAFHIPKIHCYDGDIYLKTPSDILHTMVGICRYLHEFTLEMMKHYTKKAVNTRRRAVSSSSQSEPLIPSCHKKAISEKYLLQKQRSLPDFKKLEKQFHETMANIPRYSEFRGKTMKRFDDYTNITGLTGSDIIQIVQMIPVALQTKVDIPWFPNADLLNGLTATISCYIEILMVFKSTAIREDEFDEIRELLTRFNELANRFLSPFSKSRLKFPKFHLHNHYITWIREYGCPMNWDTGTFESFHKTVAKNPYKRTNNRNIISQMHKIVRRDRMILRQTGVKLNCKDVSHIPKLLGKPLKTSPTELCISLQRLQAILAEEGCKRVMFHDAVRVRNAIDEENSYSVLNRRSFIQVLNSTEGPWYARIEEIIQCLDSETIIILLRTFEVLRNKTSLTFGELLKWRRDPGAESPQYAWIDTVKLDDLIATRMHIVSLRNNTFLCTNHFF